MRCDDQDICVYYARLPCAGEMYIFGIPLLDLWGGVLFSGGQDKIPQTRLFVAWLLEILVRSEELPGLSIPNQLGTKYRIRRCVDVDFR